MSEHTIEVENIGPIEKLEINVPPEGGICVLRGRNGSGKSTALAAVEGLVGKQAQKLTTREGAPSAGMVRGVGATVMLGRRISRSGEVEVASLEGRISIADLVQPPIKDAGAADRQRIKALVSLTGVEPSPEMFRQVIGDVIDDLEIDWTGDIVEVANRIKRALESRARHIETQASVKDGQATQAENATADIGEDEPYDEGELRAANIEAASAYRTLEQRDRDARAAEDHIAEARKKLEAARAAYTGPTVEEAREKREDLAEKLDFVRERVHDLAAKLAQAQEDERAACLVLNNAEGALVNAQEHSKTIANYEDALTSALPTPVPEDELVAARAATQEAAQAAERGAVIRDALRQRENAKGLRNEATALTKSAQQIRAAAGQIDDTLSRQITTTQLFVKDGRLYASGHPRGDVEYAELSEGERWSIAFDAVAPIVGEQGIVVLPQSAWEGLDPDNRRHVAQLAREHRLVVLTAEADEGDIRVEPE